MRAALAIAGNDLRRRTRDRSALVLGFIAPVVIAGLVSVAFQSADAFHTTVAVADLDGGPVGDALRTGLRTAPLDEILLSRSSARAPTQWTQYATVTPRAGS